MSGVKRKSGGLAPAPLGVARRVSEKIQRYSGTHHHSACDGIDIVPTTGFKSPANPAAMLDTGNVADVAPAGMVTKAGIEICVPGIVTSSETDVFVADTPERVTVPTAVPPRLIALGFTETLVGTGIGGLT